MRWIEQIYIYIYSSYLSFFFDSMSCFSFIQCITSNHAQYIYIYIYLDISIHIYIHIYTLYMYGFIGRRPNTHEYIYIYICLFIRLFFTCYLFFLSPLRSIQSVKHQVILYIHTCIHVYVYVYIQRIYTVSYIKRKGFFLEERIKILFDNLLCLFFFFGLLPKWKKHTYWMCSFSKLKFY